MSKQKSHLARFSVTFRSASCFLARFLAATSLAILSPNLSRRPGSRIYKCITQITCQGTQEGWKIESKHLQSWIPRHRDLKQREAGSAHTSLLQHKSQRGHRDLQPASASNKNCKTSPVKEGAITSGISSCCFSETNNVTCVLPGL